MARTCEDTFIYHFNALPRDIPEASGQSHENKTSPRIDRRLEKCGNREIKNVKQQF
jgi:hypothetical protein